MWIAASTRRGPAHFGQTSSAADGTLFTTPVTFADRGLFISYREGIVVGTAGARPFTFDLLTAVSYGAARALPYGTGCGNLQLTANGLPTINNAAFALDVLNVPVGTAFVGFGTAVVWPGIDLTPIGMGGCFAHTNLDLGLFTAAVVGTTGTFGLAIPNSPILSGFLLSAQGIALSPATSLLLTSSNGVELVLGY